MLEVRVGKFQTGTGLADIPAVFSGSPAFSPKFFLLWTTDSTNVTSTSDYSIAFGAGSSPTSQWAYVTGILDNTDPENCFSGVFNTDVLRVYRGTAPTLVVQLQVKSIDANGFTVTPVIASAADIPVFYMAFGGSDITNVYLDVATQPASTGTFDTTAPGFRGDFLLAIMSHNTAFGVSGAGSPAKFQIGFCDGANAALHSSWGGASQSPSATQTYTRGAAGQLEFLAAQVGAPGAVDTSQEDSFVQWLSNGFRLNVVKASGVQALIPYLVVKGARWKVGSVVVPAAAGNFSNTGAWWQPVGLFMVLGPGTAQNALSTPTMGTRFSLGAAVSATSRGAAGTAGDNASIGNVGYANGNSTTRLWRVTDGTPTLLTDGDFVSFDPDGWTGNVITANANNRFAIYFLAAPSASPTLAGGAALGGGAKIGG